MTDKPQNKLFYGDNLRILREYIQNESVDLVYLDPPFNSNRSYNVLFKDESGKVKSGDIRDLRGTVEREGAAMAIFITLEEPSRDMKTEAVAAGFYRSLGWGKDYPKIQILTIDDLLKGIEVKMPPASITFKQTGRAEDSPKEEQQQLF